MKEFSIDHQDSLTEFVGIQFKTDADRTVHMHMKKHCEGLKAKFPDLNYDKNYSTPLEPNSRFEQRVDQATTEEVTLYRSMIGKVLYIALMCRLDVAYPVSILSQYMLNPGKQHMDAIKRVIVYLANTSDYELEYTPSACDTPKPLTLMGLVDASYGGHSESCKSHSGMVMVCQSGIIHWRSMSQKTVTTSSSHAESKAAFSMAKEMVSLKGLFNEIHEQCSTSMNQMKFNHRANIVLVDNKATVDLMLEPKNQEKSRHWLVAYRWGNELQRQGMLRYKHVAGELNVSDLLTKPVTLATFKTIHNIINDQSWAQIILDHELDQFGYESMKIMS